NEPIINDPYNPPSYSPPPAYTPPPVRQNYTPNMGVGGPCARLSGAALHQCMAYRFNNGTTRAAVAPPAGARYMLTHSPSPFRRVYPVRPGTIGFGQLPRVRRPY